MSLWGKLKCLKCLTDNLYDIFLYLNNSILDIDINYLINPIIGIKNRLKGDKRIGPHNRDIYSIIFGSLLGDAYAEKRNKGIGTRISFYQENTHLAYIIWLHKNLSNLNYCNSNLPKIQTRLGKKGIVRKVLRFHTWTYTNFNFFHEIFYFEGIKKVPLSEYLDQYLTPLALAIWIMDDGAKVSKGLKLCTNSFTYSDCIKLVNILHSKFSLKVTIQSAGVPNQYNLYIWKESMINLRSIVQEYIIPEMKYKIMD
jgi:ubiquinol-cytochrome c reductase cytochrome b subunit